jgi:hypothetical protein
MAEMDKSRGLQDPADVVRRMRGPQETVTSPSGDALGDASIARQRIEQAQKMEREANGLLAEAARLTAEANTLDPSLAPKKTKARKEVVVEDAAVAKRKYTRRVTNVA